MMVLMDSRRMCPHCRAFITTKDRVCPYCNEAVAPRQASRDDSGPMLVGGFIPHFRFNTIIILLHQLRALHRHHHLQHAGRAIRQRS